MLVRLDSCVRRNDEGLSAAMEPKFWDFAESNAVFCIMRHPRKQESSQTGFRFVLKMTMTPTFFAYYDTKKISSSLHPQYFQFNNN